MTGIAARFPRPRIGVPASPAGGSASPGSAHHRIFRTGALARHADLVAYRPEDELGDASRGFDGFVVPDRGDGVFEQHAGPAPEPPVVEERRLREPPLVEHFVERVFAHARLRVLLDSGPRPRDLIEFHSRQKLQLMAHAPEGYRALGREPRDFTEYVKATTDASGWPTSPEGTR
jgi:hypothetical protein